MKPEVLELIYAAIDELNETQPADQQLAKSPDTPLFGEAGQIDSLGLVNLVIGVEQKLQDRFSSSLSLAESLMQGDPGQLSGSVGALCQHIESLLAREPS